MIGTSFRISFTSTMGRVQPTALRGFEKTGLGVWTGISNCTSNTNGGQEDSFFVYERQTDLSPRLFLLDRNK